MAPDPSRRLLHGETVLWLVAMGLGWLAFLLPTGSPIRTGTLGLTVLLIAVLAVRGLTRTRVSLESLGLFLVCVAVAVLLVILFPAEPRPPVLGPELTPENLYLLLGAALLLLGMAFYGITVQRGNSSGGILSRHLPTLVMVAVATITVQLLRRAGLAHWLVYVLWGVLGLWFAALLLSIPALYFYLKRSPVNRLARLVQKRRYAEAIELGESLPETARTPLVLFNLAMAYRLAQRPDDARAILEQLRTRESLPAGMQAALEKQLRHLAVAQPPREDKPPGS